MYFDKIIQVICEKPSAYSFEWNIPETDNQVKIVVNGRADCTATLHIEELFYSKWEFRHGSIRGHLNFEEALEEVKRLLSGGWKEIDLRTELGLKYREAVYCDCDCEDRGPTYIAGGISDGLGSRSRTYCGKCSKEV